MPRRFYEFRQIIPLQCRKYQSWDIPSKLQLWTVRSHKKISTAGVSRGPLRSSGEKQTKPYILLHVRYFYNIQKKFQGRKRTIRWHMTFSMKILYSTFCRVEGLLKPCNKKNIPTCLLLSRDVFLLLIKKIFAFLTSTARSIQKF